MIIYRNGSPEEHLVVGQVGGYYIFFGDSRDAPERFPRKDR